MLQPGFEWFIAWRHLRDPERRSRRTLVVGLAALAAGGLCFLAAALDRHDDQLHGHEVGCSRNYEKQTGAWPAVGEH